MRMKKLKLKADKAAAYITKKTKSKAKGKVIEYYTFVPESVPLPLSISPEQQQKIADSAKKMREAFERDARRYKNED